MSEIINGLQMIQRIVSGRQKEYYDGLLQDAKEVRISPITEVFTPSEIEWIKMAIKPKPKQCFRNATLLTLAFPDVKYVEGQTCVVGIPIDHAWNKRGEKYFDITFDLALNDKPSEEYVVFGEYDKDTVMEISTASGVYGDIYRQYKIKNS